MPKVIILTHSKDANIAKPPTQVKCKVAMVITMLAKAYDL